MFRTSHPTTSKHLIGLGKINKPGVCVTHDLSSDQKENLVTPKRENPPAKDQSPGMGSVTPLTG